MATQTNRRPPPNFHHQTIWTQDNLNVLRGMNSECIDLIYLDPPFNSNANYAAPIGSQAAGAEFKDTWGLSDISLAWHGEIKHDRPGLYALLQATRAIHGDSMMAYLIYMAIRLMEMKRVLKSTGSIYLHCDPTASHYLKLIMDEIFDKNNFRNEITWLRYSGRAKGSQHAPKSFGSHYDCILFYAASKNTKMTFPYRELDENEIKERYPKTDGKGRRYTGIAHFRGQNMGARPNLCYKWRGFENPHPSGWRIKKERLEEEYQDGKVVIHEDNGSRRLERRRFYNPEKGAVLGNIWTDIQPPREKEQTGYPTQKPLALLQRIIKASTNEGDLVLDPFCGCATACIASEKEHRQWVGIDVSPKAAVLVEERMMNEVGVYYQGSQRTDIPQRTDQTFVIRYNDIRNKKLLYGEQGGYCNGCETHFEMRYLEVDHIIPKAKGGTDHISNLQLLCSPCNRLKGTRSQEELLVLLTDKGWIKRKKAA